MLLPTFDEVPSCNISVFGWQLWHIRKNPPLCLQIHHAARFQVLLSVYILLRVLADTKSQEAQGLLEEIRRQSGVFVPSAPAAVITNVATASVFLPRDVDRVCESRRKNSEDKTR